MLLHRWVKFISVGTLWLSVCEENVDFRKLKTNNCEIKPTVTWKNIQNPESKLIFLNVSRVSCQGPAQNSEFSRPLLWILFAFVCFIKCFIIRLIKPLRCFHHSLVKINNSGHYAWDSANMSGCLIHWWGCAENSRRKQNVSTIPDSKSQYWQ